ncbi:hypothetical protein C8R43DRAFT_949345 [Mycena crocata]|nr:hypothetical protein C8R43DRAFT_949345 [Mycena crocata]
MPVGVNPGGESISVGEDIIQYIYNEHVSIYELSTKNITNFQQLLPLFYQIFRPYTYHHVNLRRPSDAIAFFSVVATLGYVVLANAVQSLQLSFNLNKKTYKGPGPEVQAYLGLWDFEDMTTSTWGAFWTHFRAGMSHLSFLSALSISFSHDDNNVLGRLIKENKGNLCNSLPPSSVVDDDIKQWTAQLRRSNMATSSTLRSFLNCGFGDEGGSVKEWDEPMEGAPVAEVFLCANSSGRGMLAVKAGKSAKGGGGGIFVLGQWAEFLLPWIYIDLASATKEWREWQQLQSRFMGNGTIY